MTNTLNVHIQRALSALAIAATLTGAAYAGTELAHSAPAPFGLDAADTTPVPTINLTDVPDIDSLPVCHAEDCSDVVGQTGVWYSHSTGAWLLERGEGHTWVIVDDTVTVDHGTAAADGAVPGPVVS